MGGGAEGLVSEVETRPCVGKGFLNTAGHDEEGWVGGLAVARACASTCSFKRRNSGINGQS